MKKIEIGSLWTVSRDVETLLGIVTGFDERARHPDGEDRYKIYWIAHRRSAPSSWMSWERYVGQYDYASQSWFRDDAKKVASG